MIPPAPVGKPGASAPAGSGNPDRPVWLPAHGERALTVGQTGSGKTTFVVWLLQRTENSPVVIYDTKDEPKFASLPNARIVTTLDAATDAIDDGETDYVVFRPHIEILADPVALDNLLRFHYENWKGADAYIDELYSFHNNSNAGPGLVALYTRGRSRGISTFSSTQRPARVSRFALSEAQVFFIFHLNDADDRKRVSKASGMPEMPNPPMHHFYVYRAGQEAAQLVKPVSIDGLASYGYVDAPQVEGAEPEESPIRRHLWL